MTILYFYKVKCIHCQWKLSCYNHLIWNTVLFLSLQIKKSLGRMMYSKNTGATWKMVSKTKHWANGGFPHVIRFSHSSPKPAGHQRREAWKECFNIWTETDKFCYLAMQENTQLSALNSTWNWRFVPRLLFFFSTTINFYGVLGLKMVQKKPNVWPCGAYLLWNYSWFNAFVKNILKAAAIALKQ